MKRLLNVLVTVTFTFLFPFSLAKVACATISELVSTDLVVVLAPATPQTTPQHLHYAKGYGVYLLKNVSGNTTSVNLTPDFFSARDPSISFDGETIFFSGKKTSNSTWQIFTMDLQGNNITAITSGEFDQVSPLQVGTLFYLNDTSPVPQIVYAQVVNEKPRLYGLFASNEDGKNPRQISHNLRSDIDPVVLPNGRLVYSSFSDSTGSGNAYAQLMALSIDGSGLMPVGGDQAPNLHQRMPRLGFDGKIYYVESHAADELAGGDIVSVSQLSPLHSRIVLTSAIKYLYPCPLPNTSLLASSQGADGVYSLVKVNKDQENEIIFEKTGYHVLDTHAVISRTHAKGRSSVVGFRYKDSGVFFCMDVYRSDRPEIQALKRGSVKSVLITEGMITKNINQLPLFTTTVSAGLTEKLKYYHRIIGKVAVEKDGSFQVRVPSQTPLTFHLLDHQDRILSSQQSWTWVMHGESRGCIGCHEDRELSPPNIFIDAVKKPPVELLPSPESRKPYALGDLP